MAIQIIGAGLGRTGTTSLKVALEMLLKAPCYHMVNIADHPDHIALHDLSLAARFADNLLLMKEGLLLGHGETEAMFSSSLIEEIYGIEI